MKFSHLLLAAGLCSFSAASAQTTPSQTAPRTPNSASPSAVPSGTPPVASDPKGAVSPGEVFTKGSPNSNSSTKRRKDKDSMSKDHSKMKSKM